MFIKYCVFPWNFVIFLNSASSAAALVFYLPGVCTHTDTEGKQRKARVRNILKSFEKNTIFNEHRVGNFDSWKNKLDRVACRTITSRLKVYKNYMQHQSCKTRKDRKRMGSQNDGKRKEKGRIKDSFIRPSSTRLLSVSYSFAIQTFPILSRLSAQEFYNFTI